MIRQLDIQKASLLKRLSALILDFIIIVILSTFFILIISKITNYDSNNKKLLESYSYYENKHNIVFSISADEYSSYSDSERQEYDNAYEELINDTEAMKNYEVVVTLTLLSLSLGVFFAFFVAEFIIPQFFKNGTTIGKKVFSLAVIRKGGWKINNRVLFIRSILGKYTIETMVPLLIVVMILFSSIGIVGPIVIFLIALLNLLLVLFTKYNQALHDILADTIVVDYSSQYIFSSEEEVIERKKEIAKEKANNSIY